MEISMKANLIIQEVKRRRKTEKRPANMGCKHR